MEQVKSPRSTQTEAPDDGGETQRSRPHACRDDPHFVCFYIRGSNSPIHLETESTKVGTCEPAYFSKGEGETKNSPATFVISKVWVVMRSYTKQVQSDL